MEIRVLETPELNFEANDPQRVFALNGCYNFVNGFFNTNNSCYDSEKKLSDQLTSEALDMSGEVCDWYQIDYSLYNDRIFGEDNDRRVRKVFRVKLYFELPSDNRQYTKFGIEGMDNFQVHIGKLAWDHYAKNADLEGYQPKYGDVFRPHYSGIFYEVVDVKDTDSQFLNTQHSWIMIARVWENPMLKSYDDIGEEVKETTDHENAIVEESPKELKTMKHYLDGGSDTLAQNYNLKKLKEAEEQTPQVYPKYNQQDEFGIDW